MMPLSRCLLSRQPRRQPEAGALAIAWLGLVVTAAGHLRAADPPAPGGQLTAVLSAGGRTTGG